MAQSGSRTTPKQDKKSQRFAENEEQQPHTLIEKIRRKLRTWMGRKP